MDIPGCVYFSVCGENAYMNGNRKDSSDTGGVVRSSLYNVYEIFVLLHCCMANY